VVDLNQDTTATLSAKDCSGETNNSKEVRASVWAHRCLSHSQEQRAQRLPYQC